MAEEPQGRDDGRKFDLAERTSKLGIRIVEFCLQLPFNAVTRPLISQVVRSGTSIGANYLEADEAGSKKEFRYRISLCKRESRETQHWLRMLAPAIPDHTTEAREIWKEAEELTRIFAAIFRHSEPDK